MIDALGRSHPSPDPFDAGDLSARRDARDASGAIQVAHTTSAPDRNDALAGLIERVTRTRDVRTLLRIQHDRNLGSWQFRADRKPVLLTWGTDPSA